jgi:hypothetical protein
MALGWDRNKDPKGFNPYGWLAGVLSFTDPVCWNTFFYAQPITSPCHVGCGLFDDKVRKSSSWPRSWANSSLF